MKSFTEEQWDEIEKFVNKEHDELNWKISGSTYDKLRHVLNQLKRKTNEAYAERKDVIEHSLVEFQALAICAEAVGMAQTHGDKNARLRGMIDVLNRTINRLRKEQINELRTSYHFAKWSWERTSPYYEILNENDLLKEDISSMKREIERLSKTNNNEDDNQF